MKSLRGAALLWMTATLTAMGGLAAAISYESARNEASEFLDGQLRQVALNVGSGSSAELAAPPADQDKEDKFVIDIWDAKTGAVRRASSRLLLPRLDHSGFGAVRALGHDWRVYLARDAQRIVQVGQRMAVRREMARSSAFQSGAPILATIVLAWLVIWLSLGSVLRPVNRIARIIAARGADVKDAIPMKGVPLEIVPLVESMNGLAGRLQNAVSQQRHFLSDAAHELRTPLAALRIQIDNLAASSCERNESIDEIRRGIDRASSLAAQLLRMARLESVEMKLRDEQTDLASLVSGCVADVVALAEAKNIDLGLKIRPIGTMAASAEDLQLLFGNLLENAIRYTEAGGSVDVSMKAAESSAVIEILDTGCGISDEYLPRIFDRFFRAAPSGVDGAGLGLAIADAVVRRYGLKITVENRQDVRGVRATVTVPASVLADAHSVLTKNC